MDDIKDIVKKVFLDISSKTMDTPGEQKKLEEQFEKVLKQNKISGAKISGIKDKHLFVNVDSSGRLYQINMIKNKILLELQAECPDVQKMSVKIGKA